MAQNEILLKLTVDDKGTLKLTAAEAEKTAKSLNKTSKAADKASDSIGRKNVKQNRYNKLEKGTAGLTANSTKAFSKQAQTLSGTLVPAYATLAANIFALTALFGALQRAAAFEQLQQGLITVGSAAGQNLPYVAQQLKEITGAAVSAQSAMSAVALGTSAGFGTKQLEDLTKVAKGASLALGRNLEDALTRLVRGTAKLEPEILDELGIMVRLDDAATKYATTLGKSATQLTMFERRQAFLNETIEQGLIKFGEVEKSVAANPYDQLSAAFNDLQKTGFKLLNTVLVPVVNILSKSEFALLGALIIFSKSIANSLLPGIDAAIKKQSKLAAEALTSAKAVRAEQKAIIAAQAGAIAKSSLPTNAAAVFSGAARSTKDYKIALDSLDASMQSRVNWQKRWDDQAAKLMVTQRALIKEKLTADKTEIAGIDKKIQKTQQEILMLREKQRVSREAVAATQVEIAQVKALQKVEMDTMAIRRANAQRMATFRQEFLLGKIAEAGGIKGLGVAIAGAGKQWKKARFDLMPTRLDKIALGFKTVTRGARLFGAAMLAAIPAIGTFVMLAGILGPILADMFGKSGLAKKVDEVVDSFKSFRDISESLTASLLDSSSAAQDYGKALKVEVGVMGQIRTAFMQVKKEKEELYADDLTKALKEQVYWEQQLRKAAEGAPLFGQEVSPQVLEQWNQNLQNASNAVTDIKQKINTIDQDTGLAILAGAEAEFKGMSQTSQEALAGVKEKIAALKNILKNGSISVIDFFLQFDELTREQAAVSAAIEGAKMSVSAFDKELNKIGNKPTTIFDGLVDQARSLQNEFEKAGSLDGIGIQTFLDNAPSLKARLKEIREEYTNISDKGAMKILVRTFELAQEQLILIRGSLKEISYQMVNVRDISRDNADAQKRMIKLTQERLALEIQALDKQINALRASQNFEAAERFAQDRAAKQAALNISLATENAKINEAGAKMQKRMLGYITKIVAANQKYKRSLEEIARIQNSLNVIPGGGEVSALADLNTFLDFERDRKLIVEQRAKTARDTARIEFELMKAQIAVEKAKAAQANKDGANIDLSVYDAYVEHIQWGLDSTLLAIDAERRLNMTKEEALNLEKRRAAVVEERLQTISRMENDEARLSARGLDRLALEQQLETTKQRIKDLDIDIATTFDPVAKKNKELELERLITEELEQQFEMLDAMAERIGRLSGDNMGAAAQFGADFLKVFEVLNASKTLDSDKIGIFSAISQGFMEELQKLGPEGELVASVAQGAFAVSEAWALAFEDMKDGSLSAGTAIAAIGATINAIANIQAASSRSKIASIDREIEAEKKRDGKSRESQQKLQALEKKKEAMKRKAFEQDKKMKIASAVASTALAITNALATNPFIPMGLVAASIAAAMGAAQVAVIAGTSYNGGGSTNTSAGPTSLSIGSRSNSVDLATSTSSSGELAYMRGERGVGTGASNFIPAFTGREHRASGGNVGYVVGEQGPELFLPDRPGTIVPADDTENIVTSSSANVTFQINAIDASGVEEVLRSQRGNIIGMIREAANSRGEPFLESVNIAEDNAMR